MTNRHRAFWSAMGGSKYELEPDLFNLDTQANLERFERKKQLIKDMIDGMMKSDPARQEETFFMFVEALRDWRENT
jgi:hypothetical protein